MTMHIPAITTLAAGVLGLIFAVLSSLVVMQRRDTAAPAEQAAAQLLAAVRAHANFAEYVPLALLLIGLIELRTGPTLMVKGLAACLVLGRILHPVGMRIGGGNPFRSLGFVLTMVVVIVAAIAAVLTALG